MFGDPAGIVRPQNTHLCGFLVFLICLVSQKAQPIIFQPHFPSLASPSSSIPYFRNIYTLPLCPLMYIDFPHMQGI
jgi:hypothetical protein